MSVAWCCCAASAATVADLDNPGRPNGAPAVVQVRPSADAVPQVVVEATSVMVVVRVRPLAEREKALKSLDVCVVEDAKTISLRDDAATSVAAAEPRRFTFDAVLGQNASQQDVFVNTGRIILDKCMAGYNGCVFAYGQTGSGKTFTMEGGPPPLEGVMPRLVAELFQRVTDLRASAFEVTVESTYVEIYQESIRDLLSPAPLQAATDGRRASSPSREPAIREKPHGEIFLENVCTRPLASLEDVMLVIREGTGRRTKGETAMNAVSSRSHAVLTLSIAVCSMADEEGLTRRVSKLHLIDLAGSERADATQATGVRLKEGAKINLSLSALGNVINALTAPGRSHVPYRDSKLTRLLTDSLGGNSFTLMIACVSPASVNADETLATLRFAERAKKVKNAARVNQDPAAQKIAALQLEIQRLIGRVRFLEDRLRAVGQPVEDEASRPAAKQPSSSACCVVM